MVDLVPGTSVIREPRHKVALWVLEARAGNYKAVRRSEIHQAVTISAPRANLPKMCRVAGSAGPGLAFQSPATISMSPAGTLLTAS